jgi:hypothetical protein
MACQKMQRLSRCQTGGLPGEHNLLRVLRSERRFLGFIATSLFKVLRRPVESAQYVSIKYTERLAQAGIEPSVGSVGDSYDNALAETINGRYKAEVIQGFRNGDKFELRLGCSFCGICRNKRMRCCSNSTRH